VRFKSVIIRVYFKVALFGVGWSWGLRIASGLLRCIYSSFAYTTRLNEDFDRHLLLNSVPT
jgi:hypothetical protein